MKSDKKSSIQFQIDQLRKDKIIYAIESCATSLILAFGYIFVEDFYSGKNAKHIQVLLFVIAFVYFLYMGIGNATRLKKIQELSK